MDPLCTNKVSVPNVILTNSDFLPEYDPSPSNSEIVTCGKDNCIHTHQLTPNYRLTTFKGCGKKYERKSMNSLAVHPSVPFILSGDSIGRINRTGLSVRSKRFDFKAHEASVNTINFTLDGQRFTTASNDKSSKIWDFETSKFISSYTVKGHKSWMTSSAFSPDGNVIITSSIDRCVRIWDVRSGDEKQVFDKFPSSVTCSTFHPNGTIIGAACDDGSFRIIDARTKQVQQTYMAHEGTVTSLNIHPSGSFAITTGDDRKIQIWDLMEGQLFYTIEAHEAPINDGRWNIDGSRFITCDTNGVCLLWQTNFDKLIETIEVETNNTTNVVHQRMKDAMEIAPPPPKSKSPQPAPAPQQITAPNPEYIETALNTMLSQLDVIQRTTRLMEQRMEMQETKLSKLQTGQRKPSYS